MKQLASTPSLARFIAIFAILFFGLTQSQSDDNFGDASTFQMNYVWALITAFHLSFAFGFSMGANEVSNAFATSVGSGAVKLKTAYILATVIESAGAVLLGYKVLQTLRFEVIDLEMYSTTPHELLIGQIAILGVSSTHSHIGSIIGFSMVMRGPKGLHLSKFSEEWRFTKMWTTRNANFLLLRIGLDKTPFWQALLISLGVALFASMSFQFVFRPLIMKWVRRGESALEEKNGAQRLTPANGGAFTSLETCFSQNAVTVREPDEGFFLLLNFLFNFLISGQRRFWFLPNRTRRDDPKTLRLFSAIQVFTGCFTGFSHGSKDIPNTIAPLATLLAVFSTAKVPSPGETPLWILCYGSFAACIGFWMLGHRVIKTVGKEFTEINSFCGFTVELGAAITVLCAAKVGIPVSMTICIFMFSSHYKVVRKEQGNNIPFILFVVGSIVAVGAVRGSVPVNWQLFRKAFLAWICTFPLSGVFSACIMFGLKHFFLSNN
ncbi:hypothetical protein Mgra_00005856, partial [Meloidogyne graminicola]